MIALDTSSSSSFAAPLLSPSIHFATLAITAVSGYYVYRQRTVAYRYAKTLLVLVHIFYAAIVFMDVFRDFSPSQLFMTAYAVVGPIFVLADVALLTALALVVFFRPSGLGYRGFLKEFLTHRLHAALFAGFTLYLVFLAAFLLVFAPYDVAKVTSISGLVVPIDVFSSGLLSLELVALIVFIGYPVSLLILAARKSKDKATRRTLIILPICWSAIGVDLLAFNGYLAIAKIDATPVGYLIGGVIFGITALVFRRASLLASFFEPIPLSEGLQPTYSFTKRLGVESDFLPGKKLLLELDPSVVYEQVLQDFTVECLSAGFMVYVFTSRGSPIYNSLSEVTGVRLYILTGKVSYPTPGEKTNEVSVPENDQAILLDVFERTIHSNVEAKIALVYDNVSDQILSWGFEETYKFLKQVNEMVNEPRVTTLFLITSKAHNPEQLNLIKSIFPIHFINDDRGLRITRKP